MDQELFENLLESVKEAGAVLRGEREAARRTRFDEADGAAGGNRALPALVDSDEADND